MAVSKINLMIVDDEILFRQGIVYLLKKYGIITSCVADNGEEALELLKSHSPEVILLDLEMPILNGSLTLNKMLQRFPKAKIIIVTSYHDEELIKDYFNRGAFGFISKNENIKTVVAAIKAVHKGSIYKENIPQLLQNKCYKDGHYYKMIYTSREKDIIYYLCKGDSIKEISIKLSITEGTIAVILTEIYRKANVKNRAEFLTLAFEKGLQYLDCEHNQR